MAHLSQLVRTLRDRTRPAQLDRRELDLIGAGVTPPTAEQHLRAIGILLVTLETYLRGIGAQGRTRSAETPSEQADVVGGDVPATGGSPDASLAAAAARYIARDLAARRLSEFTSAEGYRLARELARIGNAEEAVERLLDDAKQIRLHPAPLTEALSHSAH